ncbi:MAG TPA: penicillin-binding protein 2 [Jatrophihabitantaceae bacterium]|nr:penicillin-binding protein 2 [Jatrophihabitantaceae bacterium]
MLGALDKRLRVGFAAVCTLLVIVGGRLVQLQGVDHANYADAAAAQRLDTIDLHALRGQIVDRNGTVLAYTTSAQDITADPAQIAAGDRATYALKLAPLVQRAQLDLMKLLAGPGQYAVLARALPPQTARAVEKLGLRGIYTQATTQRQYPGQTTGANVIGFVHSDGSGGAGVEYQYDDLLAGKDGRLTYAVDGTGKVNPSGPNQRRDAVNGGTVRLTIDQDLQYTVQKYLDSAVRASGARGAQVAVLDARTGQVLSLASNGTFNSADPSTLGPDETANPAIQTVFEPGSANKVVTFSAAVEKGLIKPSTKFTVPNTIQFNDVTVHDAWWHPTETFTATGVLAESSNVGTLQIAQKVGEQSWYDYEKKFGIGTASGIELPGESQGILPAPDTWSGSSFANLPIGQGEAMTVLQLASMYQTIANNGVRVPPRITASVTDPDGATRVTRQPTGVRVVSPKTAKTVRTMLESVTLPGGTGVKAAIDGYRIAGKTGTAQQPDPNHGGQYSDWMNWDTFAGIAPADNPQFVVAIMVDNPAHGLEGGDVAAPLYHEIATYELQHARIPPTGSQSKHVPLQVCDATTRMASPSTVC